VLVLETLLWPDEVRAADFGFLDEDIEVRSQELRMATSLIDSMTVDFEPEEYHDRYREALQELVDAKVEGREVVQPEPEQETGPPTSLADALKASLAAARGEQSGSGTSKGDTKRAAGSRSSGARSSRSKAADKDDDGKAAEKPAAQRRTRKRAS
jgi:DNA end-binding protein Ku